MGISSPILNRHLVNSSEKDDSFLYVINKSTLAIDKKENKPAMSPVAETELLMLATNFLLYVAMILIITMLAKLYFPESLVRGTNTSYPMTRSISYLRVSDDEESSSKCSYISDGDMEECCISEEECLIKFEDDGLKKTQKLLGKKKKTRKSPKRQHNGSFHIVCDEVENSTVDILKRLCLCIFMLNATFLTWGLLQERMLTRRYPRYTGEYFTYSYALVFTNRFWTLILSGLLLLYLKPTRSHSTVIYEYSFPSISNMLSSWCQYEALRFVSFPAVTLFKSFKLAPVMAMGKILGNLQYPQYDYFVALLIGVGITMFMSSTDDLNVTFGKNIYDQKEPVWTGIMLLLFYLFFDSFTGQWQSRMFQRHRDLSMIELMFATSGFSTLLSLISLIHTKRLYPAIQFVYHHSEIHFHFFLFSICSTIGQLFIFYSIKNFGAVVFTLIMTTRVMLSIALSCFLYGHKVSSVGFFGLMTVLGAICYRIKRKAESQKLVKWRGFEENKSYELVHEWHEHVDT